MRQAILI